jgi:hypothetical protein
MPYRFRWRPALSDPDDDRILELAVRTQAAIVTFNARDFAEAALFGIRVIKPQGDAGPRGRQRMNLTINIPEELYEGAK